VTAVTAGAVAVGRAGNDSFWGLIAAAVVPAVAETAAAIKPTFKERVSVSCSNAFTKPLLLPLGHCCLGWSCWWLRGDDAADDDDDDLTSCVESEATRAGVLSKSMCCSS